MIKNAIYRAIFHDLRGAVLVGAVMGAAVVIGILALARIFA